jgi:mRNA-degrading endonuclease RelE of RelBE toxin-antitoxin system
VVSQKEKWSLVVANKVTENIEALSIEDHEKAIGWLECIQQNPRGGDTRKVRGSKDIYRTRLGRFRAFFRVLSKQREIHILIFDSKGDIKDKTIQRLKRL